MVPFSPQFFVLSLESLFHCKWTQHHKLFVRTLSSISDLSKTWPSPRYLDSCEFSQLEQCLCLQHLRGIPGRLPKDHPSRVCSFLPVFEPHAALYPALCLLTTSFHVTALYVLEAFVFYIRFSLHYNPLIIWLTSASKYMMQK